MCIRDSTYNIQFKEQMDESLYKVVVGYVSMDNIANDETLKDPYVLIRNLGACQGVVHDLVETTTAKLLRDQVLQFPATIRRSLVT